MKNKAIFAIVILGLMTSHSALFAQAEGGNSVPSGGASGVSGIAGSATGGAADHGTGGKNTSGGSSSIDPSATNAPSGGEYHPPLTSPAKS